MTASPWLRAARCRIAPHNLREIAAATIASIDDPAIDVGGLMGHLPGPDFPTGGILLGGDGIATAYATGRAGACGCAAERTSSPSREDARCSS